MQSQGYHAKLAGNQDLGRGSWKHGMHSVSWFKKKLTQNSLLQCKVQIICQEFSKTFAGEEGGTSPYLKFSSKIIALSQNISESLTHMQYLFSSQPLVRKTSL